MFFIFVDSNSQAWFKNHFADMSTQFNWVRQHTCRPSHKNYSSSLCILKLSVAVFSFFPCQQLRVVTWGMWQCIRGKKFCIFVLLGCQLFLVQKHGRATGIYVCKIKQQPCQNWMQFFHSLLSILAFLLFYSLEYLKKPSFLLNSNWSVNVLPKKNYKHLIY